MNPQAAQHLCKLLGMLGSSHDGEVESAGRKAHNFIRQLNVTWPEIIHAPATSWRRMAIACANQRHSGSRGWNLSIRACSGRLHEHRRR
jgi:hypothetical protein